MTSHEGDLSNEQISVITALSAVSSVLSLLGSLFIIACYVYFAKLRKISFSLVFLLSCTDVWNQIFDLIAPSTEDLQRMQQDPSIVTTTCMAQAVGDNFFELASVLWTTAIAATLYMTVMWRKRIEDTWLTWAKYACWCYGIPLVLTIVPGAVGAFGASGSECWIKESHFAWRFIAFYVPLWLAVTFNTVVYVRVMRLLRRTVQMAGPSDPVATSIRGMMARLAVYPFILAVIWIIPSINVIVEAASGGKQHFGLSLVAAVIAGTQGLLNSMAYGFSPGVRDALAETPGCRRCCHVCRRAGPRMCCTEGGSTNFGSGTPAGVAALTAPVGASKDGMPGGLLTDTDSNAVSTRSITVGEPAQPASASAPDWGSRPSASAAAPGAGDGFSDVRL
jgi:hypothetical protein